MRRVIILVITLVAISTWGIYSNGNNVSISQLELKNVKQLSASCIDSGMTMLNWKSTILKYISSDGHTFNVDDTFLTGGVISFDGNQVAYLNQNNQLIIWNRKDQSKKLVGNYPHKIENICWGWINTLIIEDVIDSSILSIDIDTIETNEIIANQFKYINPKTCKYRPGIIYFIAKYFEDEYDSPQYLASFDIDQQLFKTIPFPLREKDNYYIHTQDIAVSPDGTMLAYEVYDKNRNRYLQISNLSGELIYRVELPEPYLMSWGKEGLFVTSLNGNTYKISLNL